MIEYLRPLAYFVAVVEAGSIRGAGEKLSLTSSVVSRSVTDLEKRLGVSLLYRNGRKVLPTPEGLELYRHGAMITKNVSSAIDIAKGSKTKPSGVLKVTMPSEFSGGWLPEILRDYRDRHPDVILDITFDDAAVDIIDLGIDLALRFGESAHGDVIQRRLCAFEVGLVAGSEVLPADADLDEISLVSRIPIIVRSRGKTPMTQRVRRRTSNTWHELEYSDAIRVSTAIGAHKLAKCGMGAAFALLPCVEHEIASGDLVRLLPGWEFGHVNCHALYPTKPPTAAARALVDCILASRSQQLQANGQ